jgi:hypothetical protein
LHLKETLTRLERRFAPFSPPSPNERAFTPVFDGLWGEGIRVCRTR